jgi:membrane dipeptidase
LHQIAHDTNGTLTVITSAATLRSYIDHREAHNIAEQSMRDMRDQLIPAIERGEMTASDAMARLKEQHAAHGLHSSFGGRVTAGLLAIEGLHALDDDESNLNRLYDAGVRMMALSHFFDNSLGGSSAGVDKIGLTPMGRRVVQRMNELNIIIDVAHASDRLIDDIILASTKPLIVSHTGVKAICNNSRNLGDEHIRGIAKAGGLICIAFFQPAICGDDDLSSIVASMKHVANLVGVKHVCLGSDYDGTVTTSFDTSQLVHVTSSLLSNSFTEDDVRMIMGGNTRDFLLHNLPQTD